MALSTSVSVALALVGLYYHRLPRPHVDHAFVANATVAVAAACGCKLVAFSWYVWPATFGRRRKPTLLSQGSSTSSSDGFEA